MSFYFVMLLIFESMFSIGSSCSRPEKLDFVPCIVRTTVDPTDRVQASVACLGPGLGLGLGLGPVWVRVRV